MGVSCCHGALWTSVSFRQFLLPPYVRVFYSFAKESSISLEDKCTNLKSSIMPVKLLVSLLLSRSWGKSFRQPQTLRSQQTVHVTWKTVS